MHGIEHQFFRGPERIGHYNENSSKSSKIDLLIGEMNLAIQKLQDSLNSLPNSFIGPTMSTLQAPNLFSIYQYSYQQSHCTKTLPFDTYIGQPFDEVLSY